MKLSCNEAYIQLWLRGWTCHHLFLYSLHSLTFPYQGVYMVSRLKKSPEGDIIYTCTLESTVISTYILLLKRLPSEHPNTSSVFVQNLLIQSTFLCYLKVIFCLNIGTNSIMHLGSKFYFNSVMTASQSSLYWMQLGGTNSLFCQFSTNKLKGRR